LRLRRAHPVPHRAADGPARRTRHGAGVSGPRGTATTGRPVAARLMERLMNSRWAGLAGLIIALLAPFVNATPYAISVMTSAAIFVMLAAGLNIVVGYCGLLDLGYAAFF